MKSLDFSRYALSSCVAAALLAACGGSQPPIGASGAANQTQGAMSDAIARSGAPSRISTLRSWISPHAKHKKLLYVSVFARGVIDIFSVPKYSLVGQITDGINGPEGLAIDNNGNLYVANFVGNTITVYERGTTSPSRTLTESGGPTDVVVDGSGYVYASDSEGGIDVYPSGATLPIRRLTNPAVRYGVTGVGISASNSVYATGFSSPNSTGPAVVKFAHASGAGKRLHLKGLVFPFGVIIDTNNDLVVTDSGPYYGQGAVLIYPLSKRSPSEKITLPGPIHSAFNNPENLLYVPQGQFGYFGVGVYDYPSLALVTTVPIEDYPGGAALSPAPTH
jgi:hypothetical protein